MTSGLFGLMTSGLFLCQWTGVNTCLTVSAESHPTGGYWGGTGVLKCDVFFMPMDKALVLATGFGPLGVLGTFPVLY